MQLQSAKKEMKRAKTVAKQITCLLELKNLALSYSKPLALMPPSADTLATQQLASPGVGSSSKQLSMMYVPMDNAAYETEGICLTGPTQLSWISQLVQRPRNFVLHADGKHKLHHGKWVLMTVGTHYLRYDVQNQALCTTFAPLLYLICKQVETGSATTDGSANMLIDGLSQLAINQCGGELVPGATISDHCAAYRNAFLKAFPEAPFLQCWPHIARKFREGEYVKKTWEHFEEATGHLLSIHLAMSSLMQQLIIKSVGKRWEEHQGKPMIPKFWNSNCVSPWDNWSMGIADCPLCTPS